MEKHIYKTRARYDEVDQMGNVHNSKYLIYFEEARIDLVRKENYPYAKIEENGIILPVSEVNIEYKKPVKYDEDITLEVTVAYIKNMSIKFNYLMLNNKNEIFCTGSTIHTFINKHSFDSIEIPENLKIIFMKYLEKK